MNIHSEMETLSKVEQNKAEKRRRILDAALELFAERGFHGTAVPLVAKAARVGAGTIYRFFESKEVLVNEVFRDAKARLRDTLERDLDQGQEAYALFCDFWTRLVAFARSEPTAFHFLELQDHMPYLDEESLALERTVLIPIFLAVARFQSEGVFQPEPPIDATMAMIWGAFIGVMKAERMGYFEASQETLEAVRDACWRSCAAPEYSHPQR